jgi:hypothetical protein
VSTNQKLGAWGLKVVQAKEGTPIGIRVVSNSGMWMLMMECRSPRSPEGSKQWRHTDPPPLWVLTSLFRGTVLLLQQLDETLEQTSDVDR